MDRTAFRAQTAREAGDHSYYYKKMDWKERLKVAAYLISVAYNFDINNAPKMDRTKFSIKSLYS
jgi:hypothetical protein